ncbi:hypothetical protein [Mycolicibacterium austroafricanum]|uniref:hypothetical protein n=1 Tax=Mycolicibacterium austroafricanum TaxID=39687 RepID=UPI0011AE8DD1|nr:hypothetical protein [Mycolicibacterium austroafricanum]QZY47222.1 hypothetical protein K5L12_05650 [Mycolicibacterium austroafricanum]
MRKLTIIVNCTDRKSVAPHPDLRIQTLPDGDTATRFESWRRRVEGAEKSIELVNLYQGEAWLQARSLAEDARKQGFAICMLVASAGLGLRDVTQFAPSYAATFAGNQADSVTDITQTSQWWTRLGGLSQTTSLKRVARESVLLVLSENYARAMDGDLAALAERGGDYLLVGGWRTIEGLPRIPSDRDLRNALGGTVSSLSLRMARRWMSRRSGTDLFTEADQLRWSRWARTVRRSELYERTPRTDAEIKAFIRERLCEDPNLSATRALRMLRDRGFACEQKRFGALFKDLSRYG